MTTDVSPLCTYWLSLVITRVTLQELSPSEAARAVRAAIRTETITLRICFFVIILNSQFSILSPSGARLFLNSQFDLVFIDADKREYCAYIDAVYPLVPVGGFILADNTLWDGHIVDPAYDKDKQTLGLRAFNDKIKEDDRFEQVILPLRDGLTIIRKIK